jgi:hypothetical protein
MNNFEVFDICIFLACIIGGFACNATMAHALADWNVPVNWNSRRPGEAYITNTVKYFMEARRRKARLGGAFWSILIFQFIVLAIGAKWMILLWK